MPNSLKNYLTVSTELFRTELQRLAILPARLKHQPAICAEIRRGEVERLLVLLHGFQDNLAILGGVPLGTATGAVQNSDGFTSSGV